MKKTPLLLMLAVLLWNAGAAMPAEVEAGVGFKAGTYGIGLDLAFGLNKYVSVRGSLQSYDLDETTTEGGIDYDGTFNLGGVGLFVDLMPTGGAFRLTAGILDNRNRITLEAAPLGPQEIGGVVYTPAEIGTLNGAVEFDDQVLYLGIGVGDVARGKRVGFLFDLGVVFQGSGDVLLESSTGLVNPADLEAEVAEIEADISDFDLWPVVSFGLAVRF